MTTARAVPLSDDILDAICALPSKRAIHNYVTNGKSLRTIEIAASLQELAQSGLRTDARRSIALAEAGLGIAHDLSNRRLIAQGTRIKANAFCALGKYQTAFHLYAHAILLFREDQDAEGVARTLSASIEPSIILGKYNEAMLAGAEARKLFQLIGDSRRLAMLENNIGNLLHRRGEFAGALEHYQTAFQLLSAEGDSENLTIAFNNLAVCLIALNDFPRAMFFYEQARALSVSRGLKSVGVIAEYNVAYLYYLRGRYGLAINLLHVAQERSHDISNPRLSALCALDLSEIYLELNLSSEALETASRAFELASRAGLSYETARARANQAIATGQQGRWEEALKLFADARKRFLAESNQIWLYLIDTYRAVLTANQENYREAAELCRRACEFFERAAASHTRMRLVCQITLVKCLFALGETTAAARECAKARVILENVDSPLFRYQIKLLSSRLDLAAGRLDSAYLTLLSAKSEVDALRSSLDHDDLRIEFMSDKAAVIESLVEICLARNNPAAIEEGFAYVEQAKSRSLADDLRFQMNRRRDQLGENTNTAIELRHEWNWFRNRAWQETLCSSAPSPESISELEAACRDRATALAREESAPACHHKTTEPALADVVRQLPAGSIIIEYFTKGDELLAFVLEGSTLTVRRLPSLSRCTTLLRSLHFQIDQAGWTGRRGEAICSLGFEATHHHLRELYRALIEPIGDLLSGSQMLVVPHGILHRVPFHALHDGENYLIDRWSISYAPSATVFALCQERESRGIKSATVLAIPSPRAPYIREEAATVHTRLKGSRLFVGSQATREALQQAGGAGSLVHIASHSIFRNDNPNFSGIYLGDGFLPLYELREMSLPLELLVLSGCGSGASVVKGEDEQLGLVRGALLAGARSVLATHWNVHDQSTMQFMRLFYENLQESRAIALSARKAMIGLRLERPHPFFWAPFYLAGAIC